MAKDAIRNLIGGPRTRADDICWCDEYGRPNCPVHGDDEEDEQGEDQHEDQRP